MLSIIISSYQHNFYSALKNNIADTIGINYEIIKIDNPGKMGICEAYNTGAAKAQYANLLFIHEDILFRDQDWGRLLVQHLEGEYTGVIGLAGSNYVPSAPSSWYMSNPAYNFCTVNSNEKTVQELFPYEKVYALDGVFLAVKKSVFEQFFFDENIKGFHGYDTDFSLRVGKRFNNYVIGDIFIKHFSRGNPDKMFLDNNLQIRDKIRYEFNKRFDEELEVDMFMLFINLYFAYYRCNVKNIIKTLSFIPNKVSANMIYPIVKSYMRYFYLHNFSRHW